MFSIDQRPPGRHRDPALIAQHPPAPSVRQVINRLRAEWRRVAGVLRDPSIELDADEFVSVLNVYRRLKELGATIDPMAEALICQGLYQLASIETFVDG